MFNEKRRLINQHKMFNKKRKVLDVNNKNREKRLMFGRKGE